MQGLSTFSLISILYQRRLIRLDLFVFKVDCCKTTRIKVDDNSAKKRFAEKKKQQQQLNTNSSHSSFLDGLGISAS